MTFSVYRGMTVSAWFLFVLVVVAELVAPFKAFLVLLFSHHWIAKAVLVPLAFFFFGFFPRTKNFSSASLAWDSTLLSLLLILFFFIIHYFTG